jgi:hypothetical protein
VRARRKDVNHALRDWNFEKTRLAGAIAHDTAPGKASRLELGTEHECEGDPRHGVRMSGHDQDATETCVAGSDAERRAHSLEVPRSGSPSPPDSSKLEVAFIILEVRVDYTLILRLFPLVIFFGCITRHSF